MASIVVVFPKAEDAKSIKNLLAKSGFEVAAVCTTGAQAISQMDELGYGIVVTGYKLSDMLYSQIHEYMPNTFEMLLLASANVLSQCDGSNIVSVSMPLKVHDLISTLSMMRDNIERRRRRQKNRPKVRNAEDEALIKKAKELLMDRNRMTEAEAHRYIQKCSMDSGTSMVESSQMVLAMYET